jgi:lycopene beta-cyclase
MEQRVDQLRGFFSAFFKCKNQLVWAGFLAGWPGLPGNEFHESWNKRLAFALEMFFNMPNDTRIAMVLYAIGYTFKFGPNVLLRSLTPSFVLGAGPSDELFEGIPPELGDVEAKKEARLMMNRFTPDAKVTYNKKEEEAKEEVPEVVFPAPFN